VIDPVVRAVMPSDVDELGLLETAAREALLDQRGGPRWLEEHRAHHPEWMSSPERTVLVAELDGCPVGYLVLGLGRVATVESVYVAPGAREVGFGDALLEEAQRIAVAAGAELLEGTALPGDRDTKNLYERAGITARSITVSVALSDPSSSGSASR
jgi:GNAT superfamily N-acetyltransferase